MRFEQKGTSIWYGTPDAPAPEGDVPASPAGRLTGIRLTFAVHPTGARNAVEVRYRVNGVMHKPLHASLARTDHRANTQYFSAKLPELRAGDTLEYIGVVTWPGGQAPAANDAAKFPSSFKVVAAEAKPSEKRAKADGMAAKGSPASSSPSKHSPAAGGATSKEFHDRAAAASTYDAQTTRDSDAQLTALLAASPAITSALRARFIALYNANEKAMAEFWSELGKDAQLGPVVPQLQLVLQFGTLTLNNSELVSKLLAQFHPASLRDLSKVDIASLIKIITDGKIQVPAQIAAATTAATITQYAEAIVGALREAFPTDSVAKALGASQDARHQAVAKFLEKSPDFDFATAKIDAYIAAHPGSVAGLSDDEKTVLHDRLKATQRTFRVTKDGESIPKLLELELDSAYKIATMPAGSFVDRHGEHLGGEEKARQIHANATTISALSTHIIRQAQENAATGTPWMIAGGDRSAEKTLSEHIPDWQTLFGSASTCACAECRAIDGPVAYFVSLLEFLRRLGKNSAGHTPLDVLIGSHKVKGRRPDLANLKLNCANADTALPYVDLVNEIMESYVARGEIRASTAHDTPSDATSQGLDVNPEYTQTPDAVRAYEILNDSLVAYPFQLPFDRYLEMTREYLRFLGVSRYQLLQAFGLPESAPSGKTPGGGRLPQTTRLAAEALLLSEPEYIPITNQNFSGQAVKSVSDLSHYFGFPAEEKSSWKKKIEGVQEFLRRTSVTFDELLLLLGTQYLNPDHLDPKKAVSIPLTPGEDPCDIATLHIADVGEFLPPLPAFLRLWRKLGWRIPELDYALRAFKQTPGRVTGDEPRPISSQFLLIASQLKQLQAALSLSVSQIVSLWKDIDTDGRASLFVSLFQNKSVTNPPDPAFRLLYRAPRSEGPARCASHALVGWRRTKAGRRQGQLSVFHWQHDRPAAR